MNIHDRYLLVTGLYSFALGIATTLFIISFW